MKAHIASLLNAIVLIVIGGWGYFISGSPTSLIPVAIGVALIFLNNGIKNSNKVIAHIAVLVTLLSATILKEKVGLRRWIAVVVGFIGVVIILRPGFNTISLASLAALGTGICYSFYVITTRKLSSLDSPLLTLIFTGLIGAIIISLIVPFVWITPSYNQLIIMIGLALAGTLGHFLLILSFNFAEASKLAPFAYFEIVTNILIAYYFFGDFPDKWIWAGLIIIITSGVYIIIREHVVKKIKSEPSIH